jgi:hypothetical protein
VTRQALCQFAATWALDYRQCHKVPMQPQEPSHFGVDRMHLHFLNQLDDLQELGMASTYQTAAHHVQIVGVRLFQSQYERTLSFPIAPALEIE